MTKRMIDADALNKLVEWLDTNFEYCNDIHNIEKKAISLKFLLKKIQELATLVREPQENCKSNLTKFTMQLFEAFGQNVKAGKIAIDDDDFDKMETIAFRLIDAMNLPKDRK
jgi:hypothetical protein